MIRKYKSPGDFWALETLISTISLFIYSENPATQPISKSLPNGNLGKETYILRQITLHNLTSETHVCHMSVTVETRLKLYLPHRNVKNYLLSLRSVGAPWRFAAYKYYTCPSNEDTIEHDCSLCLSYQTWWNCSLRYVTSVNGVFEVNSSGHNFWKQGDAYAKHALMSGRPWNSVCVSVRMHPCVLPSPACQTSISPTLYLALSSDTLFLSFQPFPFLLSNAFL